MSERKTAEIKFRITPTQKAAWQAQADSEEIGLSEMIREATEQHVRVQKVIAEVRVPTEQMRPHCELPECTGLGCYAPGGCQEIPVEPRWPEPFSIVINEDVPSGYVVIKNLTDSSPQEDVGTTDEVGSVEEPWDPWAEDNLRPISSAAEPKDPDRIRMWALRRLEEIGAGKSARAEQLRRALDTPPDADVKPWMFEARGDA